MSGTAVDLGGHQHEKVRVIRKALVQKSLAERLLVSVMMVVIFNVTCQLLFDRIKRQGDVLD